MWLITGQDILKQLKDVDLGNMILIPRSMLKAEEDYFWMILLLTTLVVP